MNLDLILAKVSFSSKLKVRLLRQIQRLIKAGIPLSTTLDMLYNLYSQNNKKPKDSTAIVVNEWRKKLKAGRPLASCLEGWITPAEQLIIEAGEQSDKLPQAILDALQATTSAQKIRKTIIGALAYPVLIVVAMCLMLYGFSTQILPTFSEIVDPVTWTGNARRMYVLSQFITNWFPYLAIALVVLGVAISLSLPRMTGPARPSLDKIPPYSIYKVIQGASFMLSMRGFISAGISIPDALRRIKMTGNPYVKHRTQAILNQVNQGRNLGEAMQRTGHKFPDPTINGEISIYAGLDEFSDNLDMLAKEWIEDSVERAQQSSKILGNVTLVLLAGSIAFMAMAMLELNDLISRVSSM